MKAADLTSRVLAVLERQGPCSIEELWSALPEFDWVQLVVSVDKLARGAEIAVWRTESGEYRVITQASLSHQPDS